MSKHTKGPWQVRFDWDVTGYPCFYICGMAGDAKRDVFEMKANALLIAAAPDLLAACKFVAQRLQGWADGLDCAGDSSSSMALQGWADDLKAAVKKAEGVM